MARWLVASITSSKILQMSAKRKSINGRRVNFTYLIVRGCHYTEIDEQALFAETRERLGKDMRVRIEYVDGIQRTTGGKLRFVISVVKGSFDRVRHPRLIIPNATDPSKSG
jgi:hypothetical protein